MRVTVEHVVKRGLLFVFLAVVVVVTGCAHGHVVMAPDGQPATYVTCRHQSKCFAKAQRICPWGYQVLDEVLRQPAVSLWAVLGSATAGTGSGQSQHAAPA